MQNNNCFSIAAVREDTSFFLNLSGISSQTLERSKGLQFQG